MLTQSLLSLLHAVNPYDGFEPLPGVDLQGWNGNKPIFAELIERTEPQTVIEVGSWKGQSSVTLGKHLQPYGGQLICVDTWLGSTEFWTDKRDSTRYGSLIQAYGLPTVYYRFLTNVVQNGLQDTIIPLPQTSANAARILKHYGITANLIYIDASHEAEDVYADLRAYWPLLSDGGIMFGDDYCPSWPGVMASVDEFAAETRRDVAVKNNFWMLAK